MQEFLDIFDNHKITRNAIIYPNKNRDDSNSYNLNKVHFLVVTFAKTGTTSLTRYLSLSKIRKNNQVLINVIHCHTEACWLKIFPFVKQYNFDIKYILDNNFFTIKKNNYFSII